MTRTTTTSHMPPLPLRTQLPAHAAEFIYRPRTSADIIADTIPPIPTDPVVIATVVVRPDPSRTTTPAARDWTVLRVECSNPWRTIRRRKQRLRPRYADTCPRAPRIAGAAVVSPLSPPKPVPVMSLLEGRSQNLPLQPAQVFALVPLHPDDPIHPDDTTILLGLDFSLLIHHLDGSDPSLALACAWELPEPDRVLDALAFLAWGSSEDVRRDSLADLPADLFVFLGVLSMVSVLECDFGQFLVPAGSAFIKHWVIVWDEGARAAPACLASLGRFLVGGLPVGWLAA
ncbi:hypothetical protein R3P38DRAFT_3452815 [Favolaschia claudopus]|uniref:Uncharacterized protein n=1 Tax=Favolaschia claudopus TaxID=2862362 RepID=A0AAW0CPD2_9AGAR